MSAPISNQQRGLFFLYVRSIGKPAAYEMLSLVSKGKITSMKSPELTPGLITTVLGELGKKYPNALAAAPAEIKKGGGVIEMITTDLRNAIYNIRDSIGMSEETFLALCQKTIARDEPMSQQEGTAIFSILVQKQKDKRLGK